jgi:hypothetical protein
MRVAEPMGFPAKLDAMNRASRIERVISEAIRGSESGSGRGWHRIVRKVGSQEIGRGLGVGLDGGRASSRDQRTGLILVPSWCRLAFQCRPRWCFLVPYGAS